MKNRPPAFGAGRRKTGARAATSVAIAAASCATDQSWVNATGRVKP